MRLFSWAWPSYWLVLLLLACHAAAATIQPSAAAVSFESGSVRPDDASWQQTLLPADVGYQAARFRIDFKLAHVPSKAWAVYLPFLYGGGQLFLNGQQLARIAEATPTAVVRYERPYLLPIPPALLRDGSNQLIVNVAPSPLTHAQMPALHIGPTSELQPIYERRLFWTRTMSQFTVLACLVVGTLSLAIWGRRREEVLYGLFGAAALLWAARTMTFVVEVLPSAVWHFWRVSYYAAMGGFALFMLLFAMVLAGVPIGRVKWLLLAYAALGPVGYAVSAGNEVLIGRFWIGGLLPIGAAVLALSVLAAWRVPSGPLITLSLSLAISVLAGIYDYLLAEEPSLAQAIAPEAAASRIFVLNYAANALLIAMGVLLAERLVDTLNAVEQLNCTLESRVAESRRALEKNYERIVHLERRHAALRERQDIMRDLHDGLGSSLSLMLSRAESGRLESAEVITALRDCISDMRLTLDAMDPSQDDFLQVWSNFRFRWQQRLEGTGLASQWDITTSGEPLILGPQTTSEVLRIVQEALTNVVKHARATQVSVRVRADSQQLHIDVGDDGGGLPKAPGAAGHGLANMRARALKIGADLQVTGEYGGVHVLLTVPRHPVAATAPAAAADFEPAAAAGVI